MADYECPECRTGFTEKAGRVKKEQSFDSGFDDSNIVGKLIQGFVDVASEAMAPARYEVHCPKCGEVIVGEEQESEETDDNSDNHE